MRKIILETLKCYETEDWTGADECRLEVYADGTLQPYLKKSLNDGQKWYLNKSYKFKNKIEIKLWDEDSPDPDDYLGGNTISTSIASHATVSFKRDDANYKLWYSVVDEPDADPVQEALNQFKNSSKPGIWPYIQKSSLIADIMSVINNAYNVNQGRTPLCGPAAIVFELAARYPAKYIKICQDLYETGQFKARTHTVKPSTTLVKSKVKNGISVADWMLMATLRDTENALFPVSSGSNSFVMGFTTPWEMKGWTFELLGFSNVEYESTYVYGEFDAMKKAKQVRNQGGVAFLMIHSAMLGQSDPAVGYPNHWVSFLGDLVIDEGVWYIWDSGNIKFKCYSWGRIVSVDIGEGPFEDYMWGVVTGKA
jgi:hypothetical protein